MKHFGYAVRDIAIQPASEFIRSLLSADWHPLGGLLLPEWQHVSGRVESFLPADCSVAASEQFKTGGATSSTVSLKWIVDTAFSFLQTSNDRVLVVQDPLAGPHDPGVQRRRLRVRSLGETVYHVCQNGSPRDEIEMAFRYGMKLPFTIAILTSQQGEEQIPASRGEYLERESLRQLASQSSAIVVNAYDDEGFLMWWRHANAGSEEPKGE